MTIADLQSLPAVETGKAESIVNNFSINVASPNGSGSQTSNLAIIRALFQMGIAVNGKNLFPSNIQGLPTWYIIRLSKDGYRGRKSYSEILVAWNQDTFARDIQDLAPGSVVIYPLDWKNAHISRDDLYTYRIPVKDLMADMDVPRAIKNKVANMVYVGGVASLLGIDLAEIEKALSYELKGKAKAVKINQDLVNVAAAWADENWDKQDPYRVERPAEDLNAGKFLVEGNDAAALGTTFGGCTFVSWYPITPSTSVVDNTRRYMKKFRHDADDKPTYAIIQAEDELAAAGMVLGAGWAGARSMTATSGPGISLMSEFIGLGYFAELPGVFWNIQRMGPSTGLPTRTSQGDILSTHFLGHGDTKQIVLLPASPAECFEFGWKSFDITERFMTPVFVLSDLDLGMNLWTSDDFDYPDEAMDRGRVLTPEDIEQNGFARYKDKYGDGVGERTLPGTEHPHAAYFTRGTGHDEYGTYSEDNHVWVENMERLVRKIEGMREHLPQPIIDRQEGARIAILSYGSNEPALEEARDMLLAENMPTDYCRIRALPAAKAVHDFIEDFDYVYVVENNRDGQMAMVLRLDMPHRANHILSINMGDGLPLTARFIVDTLKEMEG